LVDPNRCKTRALLASVTNLIITVGYGVAATIGSGSFYPVSI
jgi:hypothetical protein